MGPVEEAEWEEDLEGRGSGTEGGLVVDLRAAKYRHSAGPKHTYEIKR